MLSLIKQVFIVLWSFSISLATNCFLLNDEPCMLKTILTDLNHLGSKYYLFLISLDKCTGSCKVCTVLIQL